MQDTIDHLLLSLMPSEKHYLAEIQRKQAKWIPQSKKQWQAFLTRADELFYGGGAGGGKLLPLDTPIPTIAGWKTIGNLRPGDQVFSDNGTACEVLAISRVETPSTSYRLVFDDGSEIVAGGEHKWLTYDAVELRALTRLSPDWRSRRRDNRSSRVSGRKSKKFTESISLRNRSNPPSTKPAPSGTIRTTDEIFNTLLTVNGRRNHAIPLCGALDLPYTRLPLDPYCLGAWLGDGTAQNGGFTGIDPEIWLQFENAGFEVTHAENGTSHYVKGIAQILRGMGVIGNKHIPAVYLRGSKNQRLALLQGLMDTDGTVCGTGSVEFTNTNKAVIDSVYEIVTSLGWKSRIVESRAFLKGKDCGPKWDIKWTPSEYVFRLSRKRNKQKLSQRRTTQFRYIVACDPVEPVPMRCIEVDSAKHLYLAGRNMVPTHNSEILLGMAGQAHKNSIIFRRTFPNLRALIERSRQIYDGAGRYNESLHIWRLNNGSVLEFGSMQYEKDKFNFQGRPHDFIGVDEAPEFTESQIVFVTTWGRSPDPDQRVRVILTGNPPTQNNFSARWIIRRYAAWLEPTHHQPALPGELRWYVTINEKEEELLDGRPFVDRGEMMFPRSRTFIPALLDDNPFYQNDGGRYKSVLQSLPEVLKRQMLYGDFHAQDIPDPFQVIPTAWVLAAQKRWSEREKPDVPLTAVGIDPSRGGADKTGLARRYDNYFDYIKAWPGEVIKDGPILAELSRQELGEEIPGYINIDVSAIGSSGYDHLKPMYNNVIAFNPAEGSVYRDKSKKLKMRNKRAEMYWRMRDALDPNGGDDLALPPDKELLADLCSARYEVSSAGVKIEEKEEIKKRIGRSPDVGEAVMMCNFPERSGGWVRTVG